MKILNDPNLCDAFCELFDVSTHCSKLWELILQLLEEEAASARVMLTMPEPRVPVMDDEGRLVRYRDGTAEERLFRLDWTCGYVEGLEWLRLLGERLFHERSLRQRSEETKEE